MAAVDAVTTSAVARREARLAIERLDYHLGRGVKGAKGVSREIRFLDKLHERAVVQSARAVGVNVQVNALASFGDKAAGALRTGNASAIGRAKSSILADFSADSLQIPRDQALRLETWRWTANASACPSCLDRHGRDFKGGFTPLHPSCLCIPQSPDTAGLRPLGDGELASIAEEYGNPRYLSQVQQFKSGSISRSQLSGVEAVNLRPEGIKAVAQHVFKREVSQTALPGGIADDIPRVQLPDVLASSEYRGVAENSYDYYRKDFDPLGPWDDEAIANSYIGRTLDTLDTKVDDVRAAWSELFDAGEVRIDFSRDALDDILSSGRFKNQFETGTSGGNLDNAYRSDFEKRMFGVAEDAAPQARPIYGYTGKAGEGSSTMYGDVSAVLKSEVRERSTMTMGDSLAGDFTGSQTGAFPWKAGDFDPITSIDWERFDLDGPDAIARAKNLLTNPELNKPLGPGNYVENQIWGGVTVEDIEELVFTGRGPVPPVVKQLREAGIKWSVKEAPQ